MPTEATAWPESRAERASVSAFGIGGANVHVIVDSARNFAAEQTPSLPSNSPQLLLFSTNTSDSVNTAIEKYGQYIQDNPDRLDDLAYTLANRREHLTYRAFSVASNGAIGNVSAPSKCGQSPGIVMVFTGQGAQCRKWAVNC